MFTAQFTAVFLSGVITFIPVNGSEQIPLMFAKKTSNEIHIQQPLLQALHHSKYHRSYRSAYLK